MSDEELQKELLHWNKKDTLRRIRVLDELGFRHQETSSKAQLVRKWTNEALDLASRIRFSEGRGNAYMILGVLEELSGNLEKAKTLYHHALVIRRDSLQDHKGAASVCNNLGLTYEKQTDSISIAFAHYNEGIRLLAIGSADNTSKKRLRAKIYNNKGELLADIGKFNEALVCLDSSLAIRQTFDDPIGTANVLLNQGLVYKRLNNHVLSIDHFEKSLELFRKNGNKKGTLKSLLAIGNYFNIVGDYKQAITYYQQILDFSDELPAGEKGNVLQDKALAHLKLGEYKKAEENLLAALQSFQIADDDRSLSLIYLNLGVSGQASGRYEEAVEYYKRAVTYLGASPDVSTKANLLSYLSEAYLAMKMPDSASKYTSTYLEFQDSVTNALEQAVNNRYNLALAENEVQQLNLARANETRKKMEAYLMAAGLLVALVFMLYYMARQSGRLAEQEARLSSQQLAISQQELSLSQEKVLQIMRHKELETNYARLNGIETASKRLGQELHDNVGSMLSTVKMYFSSLDNRMNSLQEENRRQYQKANDLLDEACREVRRLSHEMASAILMKFGLKAQLESLAETLRNTGKLQVELATFGLKERLDGQTETNIYRMIQEMVQNVVKHAQAAKVSIQVNRFEDVINVMVEDDGAGFEVEKVQGGFGLVNLKARVHELAGRLHIDSTPGKGTSISVDIPLEKETPLKIKTS